ncbi:hypothetical protein ABES25_18980 [Bacillus gobiensis]|uniref:hypothetical protein n=1 Tax=Bacillus gobiensis TaxID=1441095 RepID=UPI003D235F8B
MDPVLKKLQYKDQGQPVFILNAPLAYDEMLAAFPGDVHKEAKEKLLSLCTSFRSL